MDAVGDLTHVIANQANHPFASQTYAYRKTASLSHKLGNIKWDLVGVTLQPYNGRKKKIFAGHTSHWQIMGVEVAYRQPLWLKILPLQDDSFRGLRPVCNPFIDF